MDATTESIAHFIGLFQTTLEEARLRQELEKFTTEIALQDDLRAEAAPDLWLDAPHDLEDYDPGLTYRTTAAPSSGTFDPIVDGHSAPIASASIEGTSPPLDVNLTADPAPAGGAEADPPQDGPQPGSVATLTYQAATLIDDDLLLNDLNVGFVDPAQFHDALAALAGRADALAGFEAPALPADGSWSEFAREAVESVDQATPPQDGEADVAIFRGDDAAGAHVDGRPVEDAPDLSDLLPERHRPEAMDEEAEPRDAAPNGADEDEPASLEGVGSDRAPSETPGGTTGEAVHDQDLEHDFSRDFSDDGGDGESPYAVDPGHEVLAGGNLAMNEIAIGSNWLDAGVFVVGGDVTGRDQPDQCARRARRHRGRARRRGRDRGAGLADGECRRNHHRLIRLIRARG